MRITTNTLESAVRDVERSVCAERAGSRGIPEGELAGVEWRALFAWAEQEGRIVGPALEPASIGGREHDVTFLQDERQWQKFTKLNAAGLIVEVALTAHAERLDPSLASFVAERFSLWLLL